MSSSQIQLVSKKETNPRLYIINAVELIHYFENINSTDPLTALEELFHFSETILKNRSTRTVFRKLIQEKVVTGPDLQATCGLSPAMTYKILAEFEKMGLIESLTKSRPVKNSRGGPRVTLYGLVGVWTPEDILQAGFRLDSLRDPGMALVLRGTQLILEDYGSRGEVKFTQIQDMMRPLSSGYNVEGISDMVAKGVSQKGLKVWR